MQSDCTAHRLGNKSGFRGACLDEFHAESPNVSGLKDVTY